MQELGSCPRIDSSSPSIVHLEQLEQVSILVSVAIDVNGALAVHLYPMRMR